MILLPVSEAYAFDHLAILFVKQQHGIVDHEYREAVISSLESSLGEAYQRALNSELFHLLYEANLLVWDMVDKATRDECRASEVDAANHKRYLAKLALQQRFWPASALTERKSVRS